jgi:hypothetical protein
MANRNLVASKANCIVSATILTIFNLYIQAS